MQTYEYILWKWSCQILNKTGQQAANCVDNHCNCTDWTLSLTTCLALISHNQKRRKKKEEINLSGIIVPNYRLPQTVDTCWHIVSSKAGVCKLQPSSQMWPPASFCKYTFIRTQLHTFLYAVSMIAFTLQWQSRGVETETL